VSAQCITGNGVALGSVASSSWSHRDGHWCFVGASVQSDLASDGGLGTRECRERSCALWLVHDLNCIVDFWY
jgi:hypothetical protein